MDTTSAAAAAASMTTADRDSDRDSDRDREVEEAYETISRHFNSAGCFRYWNTTSDERRYYFYEFGPFDPVSTAEDTMEIVELLERYPVLASRTYKITRQGRCTALACFVRNGFSNKVLGRVCSLYPEALCKKSWIYTDLLHYACSSDEYERLAPWVAENLPVTVDTSTMLIKSVLSDKYWNMQDGVWDFPSRRYEPDVMKKLTEVLASKSPVFTNRDPFEASQLPTALFIIGCDLKVLKQILRVLPKECRCLKFSEDSYRSFYGDYLEYFNYVEHFEPDDSDIQRVIDLLPLLSSLELEVSSRVGDWVSRVLDELATNENLEKLTLRIAVESFSVQKNYISSLRNLIQETQSKPIELHAILIEEYGVDWFYDMYCDDEDDLLPKTFEELYYDAIQFLLSFRPSDLSTTKKPFASLGLELECYHQTIEYAFLLKMMSCTKALDVSGMRCRAILPRKKNTQSTMCRLWNCSAPCDVCAFTEKLQNIALTSNKNDVCFDRIVFGSNPNEPVGSRFRTLKLRGIRGQGRDLTRYLVSLLELGVEHLEFTTSHGHKVDVSSLCATLKGCKRLKVLVLDGVDFGDQQAIFGIFLGAVENGVCNRLQKMKIKDKNRVYFDNMVGFVDSQYRQLVGSKKLSHLLLLAKYGISTFRDESSTPAARVQLLSNVLSDPVREKILDVPERQLKKSVETSKLGVLFDLIKESPHVLFRESTQGSADQKRGTKRKLGAFQL